MSFEQSYQNMLVCLCVKKNIPEVWNRKKSYNGTTP